jgi:tetratricopeptide (TPR) repeat protein
MVIDCEEFVLQEGEEPLKAEYVYLEKGTNPTSWTGAGIPEGILYLTNRRLFFFCYGIGSSIRKIRPYIIKGFVKSLTSNFVGNLIPFDLSGISKKRIEDWIEKGTDLGIEKSFKITKDGIPEGDIESTTNHENSFALPVDKITYSEKFGNSLTINAKKEYVRITVEKNNERKTDYIYNSNNDDIEYYCIYSTNPMNQQFEIDHGDWYNGLKKVVLRIMCDNCNESNYASLIFCKRCGSTLENSSFESIYSRGIALSNCGKYDKAIECYDKLINEYPNNAYVWLSKGYTHYKSGDTNKAGLCFHNAQMIGFYNDSDWLYLGNAFFELERYSEAIQCYEKLVDTNSYNMEGWLYLGNAFYRSHRYSEAMECYGTIADKDPYNIEVRCTIGLIYREIEQYNDSIREFDNIIELFPDFHYAYFLKATVYHKWGLYAEAIRWYNRALLLDQNNTLYFACKQDAEDESNKDKDENLNSPKICHNCKMGNGFNDNFCRNCGYKLI